MTYHSFKFKSAFFLIFSLLFFIKANIVFANFLFQDGDVAQYGNAFYVLKITSNNEKFKREINLKTISFYPHLKKKKIKKISESDLNLFKDNPVVKLQNSNTLYILQISPKKNYFTKRLIENPFCLNVLNFSQEGIFVINQAELQEAVSLSNINCSLNNFFDKNQQTVFPPSALNVNVSLSEFSQNPFLISGAPNNPVFYFQIQNNSSEDIKLLSLKLKAQGLAKTGMFKAFNIRVKNSYPRANPSASISDTINFDITEDPIIIKSKSSEIIEIDASPFSYALDYTDITFFIEKANDIILQKGNGEIFHPNGPFPLTGKRLQLISTSIGQAKLEALSLGTVSGTRQNPYLIDQGFGDLGVARFKLKEITGYEDVELQYIEFRQDGNAFNNIFKNLRLVDNRNNQTIARLEKLSANKAKFLLNNVPGDRKGPEGGYLIPRNLEADLTLVVDTLLYPDASYRTINFTLPSDIQIYAKGLSSNTYVPINQAPGFTYPLGDDDSGSTWLRFNVSNLIFSASPDSPSGNIAQNKANTVIARFNISAQSETFILEELNFSIVGENGPLQNGSKTFAANLEVLASQGQTLLNIIAQDPRLYGNNVGVFQSLNGIITGSPNGEGTTWIRNTNFTIPSGATSQIIFKTHTPAVSQVQKYKVKINFYQFRGLNSGKIIQSNTSVESPLIIVSP